MAFSRRQLCVALALGLSTACYIEPARPPKITVAAASNLMGVFDEIGREVQNQTGVEVILSYGSTAQLAKQIENGAPFDVFAAADKEHIAHLADAGTIIASSTAIYARGQLALWVPDGDKLGVHTLADLKKPEVKFIAIAQPDLAPYGKAAVDALKAAGLWDALQPKVVYGNNIGMARQYAATGNANVAFTALSLLQKDPGVVLTVDPELYAPIDQAAGVIAASPSTRMGRYFVQFLASPQAREILKKNGYLLP